MIGVMVLLSPLLRPWYRRWGAADGEVRMALPADDIVPHPKSEITCAITIRAPASRIWPWFVQLGCQRAGWYSYDLLDNGGVPSASRIIPEFQHIETGRWARPCQGRLRLPGGHRRSCRARAWRAVDTKTGKPVDPGGPLPEAFLAGTRPSPVRDRRRYHTHDFHAHGLNPGFFNNLGMRFF
jgi:hypothetical protein